MPEPQRADVTFHKVKLMTSSLQLVAEIEIPPFKPYYEILLWGSRFFRYHSRLMKPGGEEIERLNYVEAACYAIPEIADGEVKARNADNRTTQANTTIPVRAYIPVE